MEQIDVVQRLVEKYSNDLQFVTTADGKGYMRSSVMHASFKHYTHKLNVLGKQNISVTEGGMCL